MIIWLASYPRSGNTFFRILLNRIFGIETYSIYDDRSDIGGDKRLSDVVGHRFLPSGFDLHEARASREVYFIKTHDAPGPGLDDKVVYLMRDGRESTLSFHRYLNDFHGQSRPLVDTINGDTPFGGWGEHIQAWDPANRPDTLLLRFERLTASPLAFVDEIAEFICRNPRSKRLPTFEELHQVAPKFFRSGSSDSWRSEFSESEQYLFWLKNYAQMAAYGYTDGMPEPFRKVPGLAPLLQVIRSQYESIVKQNLEQLQQIDRRLQQLISGRARPTESRGAMFGAGQIRSSESVASAGGSSCQTEEKSAYGGVLLGDGCQAMPSVAGKSGQSAVAANEHGEFLFSEGKLEEAERKFIEAIRSDPGLADGYNNLAVLYWHKGDIENAVDFATAGLRLAPNHRELTLNATRMCRALNEKNGSFATCENERRGPEGGDDSKSSACAARSSAVQRLTPSRESAAIGRDDQTSSAADTDGSVPDFLVTAIISTYNSERFIRGCLDDLVAQTIFDRLEIIVVDSGSEESEGVIVKEFQERYSNIRYIRTDKRENVYGAWNRAIAEARGRYLTNANADDRHMPCAYERLSLELEASPDVALVYADSAVTRSENCGFEDARIEAYFRWPEFDARHLFSVCYVGPHPMWRRSLHAKYGDFDAQMVVAGDYDFWLRIAVAERFKHVPEVLGLYYMSPSSVEHAFSETCAYESDVARRRNWPDAWGPLPEPCEGYLRPVEHEADLSRDSGGPRDPVVSVVVPTKDRPRLLARALDSLVAQSYQDWEAIVVNDGGVDVRGVIEGRDPNGRIQLVELPLSDGVARARNAALCRCRGDVICYLDDDDRFLPDHLETVVEGLGSPLVRFVYTDVDVVEEVVGDDGEMLEVARATPYVHGEFSRDALLVENYIPINSWGHRREVLGRIGGFDPELPSHEDWDFVLKVSAGGGVRHIRKRTVEVRHRLNRADDRSRRTMHEKANVYRSIYRRYSTGVSDEVRRKRGELVSRLDAEDTGAPPRDDAGSATGGGGTIPYSRWIEIFGLQESDGQIMAERMMLQWKRQLTVHLILVLGRGEGEALAATLDALAAQLYGGWGLTVIAREPCPNGLFAEIPNVEWRECGDSAGTEIAAALSETGADWVGLLRAGDRLAPQALFACVDRLQEAEMAALVYTDWDCLDASGERGDPCFERDPDLDWLRCGPGMGGLILVRRDVLSELGGLGEPGPATGRALALRVFERHGAAGLLHVDEILYHRASTSSLPEADGTVEAHRTVLAAHLQRTGEAAEISEGLTPGTLRVRHAVRGQPQVSVIVDTVDDLRVLERFVDTLREATAHPALELVVVDCGSEDEDTAEYFDVLRATGDVTVVPAPRGAPRAAAWNLGADAARGEFLVFAERHACFVQNDWLETLIGHAQRDGVGVVATRLVGPDAKVFYSAFILGFGGPAKDAFRGLSAWDPGDRGRALTEQGCSAVPPGCLMVRRDCFAAAGGFDAAGFPRKWFTVDFCLRAEAAGYRTLWTPYALVGWQSPEPVREPGDPNEEARLYERWLPRLARDPFYHRDLALAGTAFRPRMEATARWNPAFHERPRILGVPADTFGCGEYRILAPLNALDDAALAHCGLLAPQEGAPRMPSVTELARLAPDTLLLQGALDDVHLEALSRYRRFNDVFCVFDMEDLKTDIPLKNSRRPFMYRNMKSRTRRALARCHRMTVTTEPLAEAYRHLIDDIRVVPVYLARERWGRLVPAANEGARPRVGWAGGQQHLGDLEILAPVVEATADEVDWVFFGMCPDLLRPHVKEVHEMVPFAQYPSRLASLALDLAVAPLEDHPFNVAKTNLRLLEYGILGWPVVCTDIEPYRGAPVARVPNDPERWIEAIRARIHDRDAARAEGARLRDWVLQGWMLEDHLYQWMAALSADGGVRSVSERLLQGVRNAG